LKLEETDMYNKLTLQLLAGIAAVFLLPLFHASAQDQVENSIQILVTYDYPGAVSQTNSTGINDKGDVAGFFVDATGNLRGFVRFHNGRFSAPIIAPNDTCSTFTYDITNTPTVCGQSYDSVHDTYHGYLLTSQTFTSFEIA